MSRERSTRSGNLANTMAMACLLVATCGAHSQAEQGPDHGSSGEVSIDQIRELHRVLGYGLEVLAGKNLPMSEGTVGYYYRTVLTQKLPQEIRALAAKLESKLSGVDDVDVEEDQELEGLDPKLLQDTIKGLQKGKETRAAEIRKVYDQLETIERALVSECKLLMILPPSNAPSTSYYRYVTKDDTVGMRSAMQTFLGSIDEMAKDWDRNTEALKRFRLSVDASAELARINRFRPPRGQDEPGLFFEQVVAFYKAVAEERFRLAAGSLSAEQELDALEKTAGLRRNLGAKVAGIAPAVQRAKGNVRQWRGQLGSITRSHQLEKSVLDDIARAKEILYAEEAGIPVVRPGASFKSTGRFAFGGVWHGVANYLVRGSSIYQRNRELRPYEGQDFTWMVSFQIPDAFIADYEVKDASWTYSHREYTYQPIAGGKTAKQEVWWNMLAPGTLVHTHAPELIFSDDTTGNPVAPSKVLGVFGEPKIIQRGEPLDPQALTEGWLLLLWENNAPQVPVLVHFQNRQRSFQWREIGLVAARLIEVGRCVVALPYGATAKPSRWSAAWDQPPKAVVEQCRKVVEKLTYYPLTVDEFYSVDKHEVRVWNQVSQALEIKDDWNTPIKPYIPAPLSYTIGLESGVPIKFEQTLSTPLMATKFGFFRTAEGTDLSYTIPRVQMWERHVLKPSGEEELLKELNDYFVKSLEVLRFEQMGSFLSTWCLFNEKSRDHFEYYKNPVEVESQIADQLKFKPYFGPGYASASNNIDFLIEPTQGKSYWARGWRGVRHGIRQRGDVPNYMAYSMHAAYTYAKLFGHWDLVEKHWDVMEKCYTPIQARQGWAVPGHDCMTTGWAFCKDMVGDGWRCHSIMSSMARTLGHRDYEELAAYLGSRAMMSIGSYLTENAARYRSHVAQWTCMPGDRGNIDNRDEFGFYATHQYSQIRGWCAPFQVAGSGVYDYPFFGALLDWFPRATSEWVKLFTDGIPQWKDYRGPYMGPEVGIRDLGVRLANAGNVLKWLAWTTKDREAIRKIYQEGFSPKIKDRPFRCSGEWFMTCNALPHVIAQNDPIWAVDWGRALLKVGDYDRASRTALLELEAKRPGTLLMATAVKPESVELNGRKLKADEYEYDERTDGLAIPFGAGSPMVRVVLAPHDPMKLGFPDFAREPQEKPFALAAMPRAGTYEFKVLSGDLHVGKCEPVDISAFCNMSFDDKVAGDQKGGCHDDGDCWLFPKGQVRLRGVPFSIVDPAKNREKSCVVLKGIEKPFFPEAVRNIRVGKRFRHLFFFHGTAYNTKMEGRAVLAYVLHFEGNQTRTFSLRQGIDIGEWKIDSRVESDVLPDLPAARAARPFKPGREGQWGKGASGYVTAWQNTVKEPGVEAEGGGQRGLAKLESIDIVSTGMAIPLVFAISGELAE